MHWLDKLKPLKYSGCRVMLYNTWELEQIFKEQEINMSGESKVTIDLTVEDFEIILRNEIDASLEILNVGGIKGKPNLHIAGKEALIKAVVKLFEQTNLIYAPAKGN